MYGAKVKLYIIVLSIPFSVNRNILLLKNNKEKQNPIKNILFITELLLRLSNAIKYHNIKAGKKAAITCWILVQSILIVPGWIQMSIAQKNANSRLVIPKIKKLLSKRARSSMTMNTMLIAMRKVQVNSRIKFNIIIKA